jgi:hypothetical protein
VIDFQVSKRFKVLLKKSYFFLRSFFKWGLYTSDQRP